MSADDPDSLPVEFTQPLLPAGPLPDVLLEPPKSTVVVRCSVLGCCMPSGFPVLDCFVTGCTKKLHQPCYENSVLAKHKVPQLKDPVNNLTYHVCSKTCYNKIEKQFINQPTRLPWDKDGKNGPDDPNSSLRILLDWLLQEGHYSRYRGKDNNGKRKLAYGIQLSNKMKLAGCRFVRTPQAVVKKITDIEDKFVKAHDWVNNTGQGVRERDGEETFESVVRQRCKWYFELEPIMANRSKAKPKATTESLIGQKKTTMSANLSISSGSSLGSVVASPTLPEVVETAPAGTTRSSGRKRAPDPAGANSGSAKKNREAQGAVRQQELDFMKSFVSRHESSMSESTSGMTEKERHHRKMENIEEEKVKWTKKREELAYRKELIKTKREMEEEGHSKEEILAMIPDMKMLYP